MHTGTSWEKLIFIISQSPPSFSLPPLSFSLSFSPLPPGKPEHPQPVSTQLPLIPAGIVSMAGLSRRVTYVLSSVRHHRNGICSSQKVLCPSHLFRNPSQHHCLLAESSLVAQPPIYLCCRRRHKRSSPQHPALLGCLAIIRFTRSEDHSRSGDRAWDQRAYEAGPLGQAASLLLHGSLLADVKTDTGDTAASRGRTGVGERVKKYSQAL